MFELPYAEVALFWVHQSIKIQQYNLQDGDGQEQQQEQQVKAEIHSHSHYYLVQVVPMLIASNACVLC